MRFIQDSADNLLYPHRHLPALTLLVLGGPISPVKRAVLTVPAGSVPDGASDGIKALLAEYLY